MKRREFITLLGGAAAWPITARAQQRTMPMVGILGGASAEGYAPRVAAFRQGLNETGFVEGHNVVIDYRWADDNYDRLPGLAADLIRSQAVVIVVPGGTQTVLAAKAATTSIPIVFLVGSDPVRLGLVASLNRPGGNVTGVTILSTQLAEKRLELAHELAPPGAAIACLLNPLNPNAALIAKELESPARKLQRQVLLLNVKGEGDFDTAFETLVERRAGALIVTADPIFATRRDKLLALTARHTVPAIYPWREHVVGGGLMSYGPSVTDAMRQVALYTSRILKGERASDLPVMQSAKFEMVINLKTAKALRLDVPASVLVRADEVIE
jgi:putative ABC transport system substrate-binding protein